MIIEGNDLGAVRQLEACDLLLDLLDDLLTVLSSQDNHHAGDGLAATVLHDGSVARQRKYCDGRDLFEEDRNALNGGDDDVAEVTLIFRSSKATNGVLLFRVFDVTATKIGIVVGHGRDHIMEREIVAAQRFGIDFDRVLPGLPAPGVDLADAWNGE